MDVATPNSAGSPGAALTGFAALCLVMSLFFPRFLVALPILLCLALALGAYLRRERAWPVAALIAAAAVGLLFMSNAPAGALSPAADVTYTVTGSATTASITMSNGQGGLEQQDVALPWTQPVAGARSGQFVSISAQNKSGYGDVTCTIRVNGADFKTSTSSAAYGIASCSGLAP
jgi:hypothetical protein